ncbi:hypothetical protein BdWA1_001382 [Babesia duncani]|uniref:Uncharacterized protein n=1 Tax=Babesia duncani TaxID=323732 RepID=A0AAD9UQW7_9APIC|nr:hypothetical protein BdWA1_001382 [Babesia duncani]
MEDLEGFYKLIDSMISDDWYDILHPNTKEWELQFQETLDDFLYKGGAGFMCCKRKRSRQGNSDNECTVSIDVSQRFKVTFEIMNMMEGLWLQGKRILKGIDQCESSRPLNMDQVVQYAMRLKGTTHSPPENSNVTDTTWHYELFPQYHFLGIPNVDQMHNSRLFALSKLQEQTCAPQVTFERISESMHRMRIVCSTENSTIYYQTSRINVNDRDPATGQPTRSFTAPAIYNPENKFHFRTNCEPFTVHAWAICDPLRKSGVVQERGALDLPV